MWEPAKQGPDETALGQNTHEKKQHKYVPKDTTSLRIMTGKGYIPHFKPIKMLDQIPSEEKKL
jgi:hypothetical protein